MSVTNGRMRWTVSAAALAMAIAGGYSWADTPEQVKPPQLAQAESASEPEAGAAEEEEMPDLSAEVLEDPEMIATGEAVWQEQCRHCHGRSAYPGKAPRLRPSRYEPEFVYHRVTYGFRGMPAWQDVYSEEERVAVTAYILSRQFSP
ncbi:MAG TPA: cytochrome c [Afifellaceae bacterium]|nr:cytochrome c [Afifellaceae bacterium]